MNIIKIEGRGQLPWVVIRAKGGNWVAVCDAFGLTIQAETWVKLMEDIAHTLNALFSDLLEGGELDRFLRDRGFGVVGSIPSKPDDTWFDIPFEPIRKTDRDLEDAVR